MGLLPDALLRQLGLFLDKLDRFLLEGGDHAHRLYCHPPLDSGPPLSWQTLHAPQLAICVDVEFEDLVSKYHLLIILIIPKANTCRVFPVDYSSSPLFDASLLKALIFLLLRTYDHKSIFNYIANTYNSDI